VEITLTVYFGRLKMNKAELIEAIATKTKSTKVDSENWLNSFVELVSKEMKSGEVRLAGFGTFTNAKRKARNGVNPQTGKKIRIPAKKVPKFRPAMDLKKSIK
jgi:DNA-binding protein HU-beta